MSTDHHELLASTLKRHHQSLTKPRLIVFDLLDKQGPQSMRELSLRSSELIDRASLYRNIKLFEELGIVQRVSIGWKYKLELSDIFADHHHHLSCLGCGQIMAIKDDAELEDLIKDIARRHRIKLSTHQLEIQGYCERCQTSIKTV